MKLGQSKEPLRNGKPHLVHIVGKQTRRPTSWLYWACGNASTRPEIFEGELDQVTCRGCLLKHGGKRQPITEDSPVVTFVLCYRCSSLIADKETHNEWHRRVMTNDTFGRNF